MNSFQAGHRWCTIEGREARRRSAGNRIQIVQVVDWVNELSFTQNSVQPSGLITLTAGQWYCVEVLHKEARRRSCRRKLENAGQLDVLRYPWR